MILDLTNPQGKYGGSARAVSDLLSRVGEVEKGRREMQIQEAALRALYESKGKEPQVVMENVQRAALDAYGQPKMGTGVRGAMQSVFGRFAPPGSPTISRMAAGALDAIRPLNAVQRVEQQAAEARKAMYEKDLADKKMDPNRIAPLLNILNQKQEMILRRYPVWDENGKRTGWDREKAWQDPEWNRNEKDIKGLMGLMRQSFVGPDNGLQADLREGGMGMPKGDTAGSRSQADRALAAISERREPALSDAGQLGAPVAIPPNMVNPALGAGFGSGAAAAAKILAQKNMLPGQRTAAGPTVGPPASIEADVAWSMDSPDTAMERWSDLIRQRGGDDEDVRKLDAAIRSGDREWVARALAMLR